MASIFDPNNPTAFNLLGNQQQQPFTISQENYQQPSTNTNASSMNRNQRIGFMLAALSDAFAGRDVAGRALERSQVMRQQAEVDRQRQEALRKQELIASLPEDIQRIYGVYGPDAAFKAQYGTTTDNSTQIERDRQKLSTLEKIPVELRSPEDNRTLIMLEQSVYGAPRIIPFYDSSGKVAKSITSIDLAKDPDIVERFEKQGLFTVGQKPSAKFEGKESTFDIMENDFLQAQSQLNTYNDLASIIDENRDAFTVAGSIGNLVNSARYEIQSAERLINLNNFQNKNPAEYSKLTESLEKGESSTGVRYSDILDKLSQDRAVAKSIFLKLAYGTAKEIDPSGRLSDNDVKIAMDILSNLGPNVDANLAVLENLAKTTTRDYLAKYNQKFKQLRNEEQISIASKYSDLPQFLGGRTIRQPNMTQPQTGGSDPLGIR
jgi:hypothetical protein